MKCATDASPSVIESARLLPKPKEHRKTYISKIVRHLSGQRQIKTHYKVNEIMHRRFKGASAGRSTGKRGTMWRSATVQGARGAAARRSRDGAAAERRRGLRNAGWRSTARRWGGQRVKTQRDEVQCGRARCGRRAAWCPAAPTGTGQ